MGTLKKENYQITATLPRRIVEFLDMDAEAGYRTRSQQLSMIVKEYYKERLAKEPTDEAEPNK